MKKYTKLWELLEKDIENWQCQVCKDYPSSLDFTRHFSKKHFLIYEKTDNKAGGTMNQKTRVLR